MSSREGTAYSNFITDIVGSWQYTAHLNYTLLLTCNYDVFDLEGWWSGVGWEHTPKVGGQYRRHDHSLKTNIIRKGAFQQIPTSKQRQFLLWMTLFHIANHCLLTKALLLIANTAEVQHT